MKDFSKIKVLFIDLDDTVFDFGEAEHVALAAAFEEVGIKADAEVKSAYTEINRAIWKELERGEITREVLMVERFRRLYEKFGIDGDPARMALCYGQNLAKEHYWLPGAREALIELSKNYEVYIASNGTTWIQRGRIASSDLESLVKGIFISQEIGADKPSKAYFDGCLKTAGADASCTAMIGDSLTSDIKGGLESGLLTVWVNTNKLPGNPDILPDFTVDSLADVKKLPGICK